MLTAKRLPKFFIWAPALCVLTLSSLHGLPRAHAAPQRAAAAPALGVAPPAGTKLAPTPVPAPHRVAHEVPPRGDDDEPEVPVDWVVGDGRAHHRPQMLSIDVGLWPSIFSLGAFWAAPVVPRGFIRHVNDSFDLEFGLMLAVRNGTYFRHEGTHWELWPAFGVRWNFFLTRNWSTFATFKVAAALGIPGPKGFDVIGGAGATYRIKDRAHLRLELNYPQGAVVGLSFPIGAL